MVDVESHIQLPYTKMYSVRVNLHSQKHHMSALWSFNICNKGTCMLFASFAQFHSV